MQWVCDGLDSTDDVGSLEPSLEEKFSKLQERLGVDVKEGLLNVLCLVAWPKLVFQGVQFIGSNVT